MISYFRSRLLSNRGVSPRCRPLSSSLTNTLAVMCIAETRDSPLRMPLSRKQVSTWGVILMNPRRPGTLDHSSFYQAVIFLGLWGENLETRCRLPTNRVWLYNRYAILPKSITGVYIRWHRPFRFQYHTQLTRCRYPFRVGVADQMTEGSSPALV